MENDKSPNLKIHKKIKNQNFTRDQRSLESRPPHTEEIYSYCREDKMKEKEKEQVDCMYSYPVIVNTKMAFRDLCWPLVTSKMGWAQFFITAFLRYYRPMFDVNVKETDIKSMFDLAPPFFMSMAVTLKIGQGHWGSNLTWPFSQSVWW